MNFVRGKNLVSFREGNEKCVVPIRIHNIDSLDLGKNISILHFVGSHWEELRLWQGSSFFS